MSEIPELPQPVPFLFRRGLDKKYTTVYKAVDFPLDNFAILKQNPINRDRMTEANKMLYSLQKQINDLREVVIELALTVDENVEKTVELRVEMGNEVKTVEGKILKDVYTFTVSGVQFGAAESVDLIVKDGEKFLISNSTEDITCAEGGDVEITATAQKEQGKITVKKSTEPAPTEENIIEVSGTSATKTFSDEDDGKKFVFKSGDVYYSASSMTPAGGEAEEITGSAFTVDADKEYTFTVAEAQEKAEYTITVTPANP